MGGGFYPIEGAPAGIGLLMKVGWARVRRPSFPCKDYVTK